eukprot:NODE_140_length_17926_cov_0.139620.p16 type:complete len:115 gc:universal NODE_140_length_17926_cov_0.139620:12135-11791(-)
MTKSQDLVNSKTLRYNPNIFSSFQLAMDQQALSFCQLFLGYGSLKELHLLKEELPFAKGEIRNLFALVWHHKKATSISILLIIIKFIEILGAVIKTKQIDLATCKWIRFLESAV